MTNHLSGAAWGEKWAPPCPDGHPQRLRRAVAYRERNRCELELRVPLGRGEGGACQVVIDEQDEQVLVRVLVHYEPGEPEYPPTLETEWPVRVWLDAPLGDRAVLDADTNWRLPLFVPNW